MKFSYWVLELWGGFTPAVFERAVNASIRFSWVFDSLGALLTQNTGKKAPKHGENTHSVGNQPHK